MSAQLWEFIVKAQTFKCQGRCGTRSHKVPRFGPLLPHLIECSWNKGPLGGPRKVLPFSRNEELFADINDCHIKWIFLKESNEELSSCFFCLAKQDRKCSKGSRSTFSQSKVGGERTMIEHNYRDAHEGNNLLEMWPMESLQENHKIRQAKGKF